MRFLELENGDKVAVLCEVTTDSGTKYAHVRCVFGGHEGYIKVDYLSPAQALEPTGNGVVPTEAPPRRWLMVPQPGGGPLRGKVGPTTYAGGMLPAGNASVEDDDALSRCPACNDVLSDGSQCMCSA